MACCRKTKGGLSMKMKFHGLTVAAFLISAQRLPPSINTTIIPPSQPTATGDRFGDWTVYPNKSGALATTVNQSESAFGVACSKGCSVFFNFQTACEIGEKYPVLINSPAGSFSATLTCSKWEGRNLLSSSLNETIIDAMSIGGELGVAIPLSGGKFTVLRYSLTASLRAANRALEYAKALGSANSDKELKDYTL